MPSWNTFQLCFYLSALDIDLVSSNDDECKLPPHSNEANKYPKHKTYNKNRKNDTDTGELYDAASLLNNILCNPREFHSVGMLLA